MSEHFNISPTSIRNDINDQNDMVCFLNSQAKSFYYDDYYFPKPSFKNYFKSYLQDALVDIERIIRGTFCCDFSLETADIESLRKMFPNACINLFKIDDETKLQSLSSFLFKARNINSHALPAKADFSFFYNDYSFLEKQYKANRQIIYYKGGLTIAGFIFLIANFLGNKSLKSLIRKHKLFSFVINGNFESDDSYQFVDLISKVNLESPIRTSQNQSILDAVFGRFKEKAIIQNSNFSISIGDDGEETFKATGYINDEEIYIKAGSLTRVFYKHDCLIKVNEPQLFIELSDNLPEFALVDYLFENEIFMFDKITYDSLNRCIDKLSKLNFPKYYSNKNIKTISLPETVFDFSYLSEIFADASQKILLSLEDYIYCHLMGKKTNLYSKLFDALSFVHVPNNTIMNAVHIRNWASHGYLLGEYLRTNRQTIRINETTVIWALYELANHFKATNNRLYEYYSVLVRESFIKPIFAFKFDGSIRIGKNFLCNYPHIDRELWKQNNGALEHSMLDSSRLDQLASEIDARQMIIQLNISNEPMPIYVRAASESLANINDFCEKNHFLIDKTEDSILFKTIFLRPLKDE